MRRRSEVDEAHALLARLQALTEQIGRDSGALARDARSTAETTEQLQALTERDEEA